MKEIFERVSIRKFEARDVEEEKIIALLKAAMQAPSAGNQMPWEFYVVKDKNIISSLATVSPYSACAANAPVVIVPCYRTNGLRFPEFCQIDTAIATEHILLEAVSEGLGAVWLAVAPIEERILNVRRALNIKEDLVPFALVPVGYKAEQKQSKIRFDEKRIHRV